MINDIRQNYKYIHNHTKIFKQIFIFFTARLIAPAASR